MFKYIASCECNNELRAHNTVTIIKKKYFFFRRRKKFPNYPIHLADHTL